MQNNKESRAELDAQVSPASVTEMAIVDTFTKLIFGEEQDYTEEEQLIIDAFSTAEFGTPATDHAELGAMLRELGVRQMIDLVVRVRNALVLPGVIINGASGDLSRSVSH